MTLRAIGVMLILRCGAASAQTFDWSATQEALGLEGGGIVKDGMLKVVQPRVDLHVKVSGIWLDPRIALTTWVAFVPVSGHAAMQGSVMMMGDLVLTAEEVPRVEAKLVAEGIAVTAIHNHLVGESPTITYMHVEAMGDAVKLARSIHSVLELTKMPPFGMPLSLDGATVDWSRVEAVMGRSGNNGGPVLQFSIPRQEALTEDGMTLSPFMGMATAINFQKAGDQVAATGDFVLMADEVNPVVKALAGAGITVTAIHNHMLHDQPRLIMLHFWGLGEPEKIAGGIHAALALTKSR